MDRSPTLAWVGEVGDSLTAGVALLDPDVVWATESLAWWEAFDRIERLAGAAKVLLARRVDDSHCWTSDGSRSLAEFLARRSGTTTGRAWADLETSRHLPNQPVLAGACRAGAMSMTQAAAVADAVAADPDAEVRLVDRARSATLGELRDDCARVRAAADPDPDAARERLRARRSLHRSVGPDGSWNLTASGTVDAGARCNAALDPIVDELFRAARREGRRDRPAAYAFDALIELADRARRAAEPGTKTASTTPSPRASSGRSRSNCSMSTAGPLASTLPWPSTNGSRLVQPPAPALLLLDAQPRRLRGRLLSRGAPNRGVNPAKNRPLRCPQTPAEEPT